MPGRTGRAAIVLVMSGTYFAWVFRAFDRASWTSGLGDWMDPYLINTLLEHWFQSLRHLSDPSSPPMYFPAEKTLGYSHGLILYAVAYVPIRLLVHPFQAQTLALFAVLEVGAVCLYALLRRHFRLTFVEALLLAAAFVSSQNVVNSGTGVWSQRASVFLIPSILLLVVVSNHGRDRRVRVITGFLAGLSAALMFTQDFYTAQFALFFSAIAGAAYLMPSLRLWERVTAVWRAQPGRGPQIALTVAALAVMWALYVWKYGGGTISIPGLRITSRDWWRPTIVAVAALVAFVALRGRLPRPKWPALPDSWLVAVGLGACAGALVFLWIYLPAYREHPSFPEEQLLGALANRSPARWRNPLDILTDLKTFETFRPFVLVLVACIACWLPLRQTDTKTRLYSLGLLLLSVLVITAPISFDGVSVWRLVFEPLPGFAAIRDPRRIFPIYDLAAVLGVALLMSRLPPVSVSRRVVTGALVVLLVVDRNSAAFNYSRPNELYDRWVDAPVAIDPSCASFFVTPASPTYSWRSPHKGTLYGLDATMMALQHGIPTVNGYSAWSPPDWDLINPEEEEYPRQVRMWIERHSLTGVCALDIDARTMTPLPLTR